MPAMSSINAKKLLPAMGSFVFWGGECAEEKQGRQYPGRVGLGKSVRMDILFIRTVLYHSTIHLSAQPS